MLVRRINNVYPMNDLRREFGRLFEDFVAPLNGNANRMPSFPALNVWEDADAVYAEAEVPGLSMNDLEVNVVGSELSIKGERRNSANQESGSFHRQERTVGQFARFITLPCAVDPNAVEAVLKNGVLNVKLPKSPQARPRRIEVRGE